MTSLLWVLAIWTVAALGAGVLWSRALGSRRQAQQPPAYRPVWDSGLPPGGLVCNLCGQPVESEPCPEHAPAPVVAMSAERLAEIRETDPGDWYAPPWTIAYDTDAQQDSQSFWLITHQASGTVLARLPDFAAPLALWITECRPAMPELLDEVDRCRAAEQSGDAP